ncbi:hypothetical protein GCM10011344_24960 [Dokdonia pacifica]|uniref:SMI1 / KNR4 family (SUKH-1) n=1 Tax=Dokdonia pacifica TaxID=1627892 RepID=A0A238WQA3_9FLAO|nr:hypothetical protein [Dokdonia pacifica]GGG23224.1 hypothetical protein GCM10011344_24960 [Dokdonia pacifica]SNR48736.1 hypothetical protein SAMN06265376_1011326 [Dokdonia pacifica]
MITHHSFLYFGVNRKEVFCVLNSGDTRHRRALAGGGKFCISMREEDFGSIYQVFLDGTADEPIYIMDSFENFINGLEDPSVYEVD